MSLGLPRGNVQLAPYDTEWKSQFEREAVLLRSTLGDRVLRVEHIGSTSVRGMIAKPIDLMCVVSNGVSTALPQQLERLGYEYRANGSTHDRLFFAKGPHDCRTHYLSITELDSQFYKEKLAFRDYLRAHPDAVHKYCRLKQQLAARFASDRASYTEGKRGFVDEILALCANCSQE